jgi:hypothetical protein
MFLSLQSVSKKISSSLVVVKETRIWKRNFEKFWLVMMRLVPLHSQIKRDPAVVL